MGLSEATTCCENPRAADFWTRVWYEGHFMQYVLLPVSLIFSLLTGLRRFAYRRKIFKRYRSPLPVIVIGNLTVGGTGKTPLVIWMARHLQARGYKPAIITRGYKGRSAQWPVLVQPDSDPQLCGDEAVLLARQTDCPVMAGPERAASVRQLLRQQQCDIVISDDGLQHYALDRDLEIVVMDAMRGCGNGWLLPAGPLRESRARLQSIDLKVSNGSVLDIIATDEFAMQLQGDELIDITESGMRKPLSTMTGTRVHAVAAIGNPDRFFAQLRRSGLHVHEHRFPDHHGFTPQDIRFQDTYPVLMTEKDAVKCQKFAAHLQPQHFWYLPVCATMPEKFIQILDQHLERICNGQKAA